MPLEGKENISKAVRKMVQKKNDDFRGAVMATFSNIVIETPVDTGRVRGNWQFSIASPIEGIISFPVDATNIPPPDVTSEIPIEVFGKKMFLVNNLPYAGVLEFGGYPDPVKKGTYVKLKNRTDPNITHEIRSTGGFSMLAPKGWVRKHMRILARAVKTI